MDHPPTNAARGAAQPHDPPASSGLRALGTGVPGLDAILGGGLPAERFYLLDGEPGSGKTTLALQFLLEGKAQGERGLYVTLSETRQELTAVARSHGWDLEGLSILDMDSLPNLAASEAQYTVFHPSEVELQDSVGTMLDRMEEVRPSRVVLDSVSEIRLLARDALRFRRQVLALKAYFANWEITALMLDDRAFEEAELQLHSLAHGVIRLEQLPLRHGAVRRQLRVTKLRGVPFHTGNHDFVIRPGGLQVFPRIRLGNGGAPPSGQDRFSSGSEEIDALLGGGLSRGASALLMGAPGTGKSILGTQFALAAAERGERAALYVFDERPETFLARARGLGMEVDEQVASGRVHLTGLEPTEISPGEFTSRVLQEVNEEGASLVVIDSLNGFLTAMAEEGQLSIKVHELLSYLGGRGVTTLLTLAQKGIFGAPADEVADVSYFADVVVLLRYFEAQGAVRRAISVVKQRSDDHERTIREFRVGENGLLLGEPLTDFQGVLTGVPTFTGRSAALMAAGAAPDA